MSPEYQPPTSETRDKPATLDHRAPDDPGYILVDLDRTLARYSTWEEQGPRIGPPIPAMVARVKKWLSRGMDVRIFTARAAKSNPRLVQDLKMIESWCEEFLGPVLPITNEKDFRCVAIWDDLAVTVEPNTGWRWSILENKEDGDPLSLTEEGKFLDALFRPTDS